MYTNIFKKIIRFFYDYHQIKFEEIIKKLYYNNYIILYYMLCYIHIKEKLYIYIYKYIKIYIYLINIYI